MKISIFVKMVFLVLALALFGFVLIAFAEQSPPGGEITAFTPLTEGASVQTGAEPPTIEVAATQNMGFAATNLLAALATPADTDRYKDVALSIDNAMLNALGLSDATQVTDLLEAYLLEKGISPGKLLLRNAETTIDTTDLSKFYVYDHYDSTAGIPGVWGPNPDGATIANGKDWLTTYGKPFGNPMRPYFAYAPTTAYVTANSRPFYHNNNAYATVTLDDSYQPIYSNPIVFNNTLEQVVDINNYVKKTVIGAGTPDAAITTANMFYGNWGLLHNGTNRTNMPYPPSPVIRPNPAATDPENTLKNNLYTINNYREHIYAYEDENGYPSIWFTGYHTGNYTDFLFYPTDSLGTKNVSFSVDFNYVNSHAMRGVGFLYNAGIDSSGNIHGYIVFIQLEGGPDSTIRLARPNSIAVYKIRDNVPAENFHGAAALLSDAGYTTLEISTTMPALNVGNMSAIMDVEAEITESGIEVKFTQAFDANNAPIVNPVTTTLTATTASTGYQGFGLLAQHTSTGHTCARSSAFKFSNLLMSFAVNDAFDALTGSNDFRPGNDVDHFFVNLVSAPVNNTASSDYWYGIDALRGSKIFYITQNTNNTVAENNTGSGGQTPPAPHNLTNGLNGYYDSSGPSDKTGWPMSDGTGYWDPANIPPDSGADALDDLVKWLGDYIAATTTADWVTPTYPSQNKKPLVDAEFIGTYVSGGPASLSGLDALSFETDPITISIQNYFDNTDTNHPYVAIPATIDAFEISWHYLPQGGDYPNDLIDMSAWSFTPVATELIDVDPADPGGTTYDLQNFTFEPGKIPDVSSWPVGEYIATIIAWGSDGQKSAPVYKTITLTVNATKSITSFSLAGETGTIDENAGTIAVTVPYGTNISSSTPVIIHNGASITPTGAQNFTTPVSYTVTATDNATRVYIVTVMVAPNSDASLLTVAGQTILVGSGAGVRNAPYTANMRVANSVSSVANANLTAAAGATAVLYSDAAFAIAQSPVSLRIGANHLYIMVTAQDGATVLYYDVTVTRRTGGGSTTQIPDTDTPTGSFKSLQERYADELKKLDLFLGTGTDTNGNPVYDLDSPLTRIQALVLVIRLLGLEEEALAFAGDRQFTDVPEWAWQYAAFAYMLGITNGVNETQTLFAADRPVTLQEFTAFLLRVLKYNEKNGDFQYVDTLDKALEVKLYTPNEMRLLGEGQFLRGDAVVAMVDALLTLINNSNDTRLIDTLVDIELLSGDAAIAFAQAIKDIGKYSE